MKGVGMSIDSTNSMFKLHALKSNYGDFSTVLKKYKRIAKSITKKDSHINRIRKKEAGELLAALNTFISLHVRAGLNLTDEMKAFEPLKEPKLAQKVERDSDGEQVKKKGKPKGGRPKDPSREARITELNHRYYELREKEGKTRDKALDILQQEFPEWKRSSISTYLSRTFD